MPRQKSDVYTALLFLSLLAIVAAGSLLYADFSRHGADAPPVRLQPLRR